MPKPDFRHIRTWVFDLDNTLYPPHYRLFDQIEARMTAWVSALLHIPEAEADALRYQYWCEYGTTLAGLMHQHDIDPQPFLDYVHDISLDHMQPDFRLRDQIANLEGLKIVYTNGSITHGHRVLEAQGILDLFDHVYGIEDAGFIPKPKQEAYDRVFAKAGFHIPAAVIFEDDPRNLIVPHQMGMRTVHVAEHQGEQSAHIHHHTDNLCDFLAGLNTGRGR